MIAMDNWATKAVAKMEHEIGAVKERKAAAMAGAVMTTLRDFCVQNEEFAQAVAQGGAFKDCMAAVAQGVCSSISDMEAYGKAVQFYFPGAKIHVQMDIDLIGDANREPDGQKPSEDAGGIISINLDDFFI